MKQLLVSVSLWLVAAGAGAHDTWFQPLAQQPGSAVLALGTGTRFPRFQFPVGAQHLRGSGCRADDGEPVRLTPVREQPAALLLQAGGAPAAPGLTCWAQLLPSDIELAPAIVRVYLDEIHATDAVRRRWAGQQALGLAWKERYTKHARIELGDGAPMDAPTGMDMDVRLEGGQRRPRAGDALVFQVLREGQPLAGQPMELVGEDQQSGGWADTDGQGRVRFTVPAPGRWVLRGTALRAVEGGAWDSGFVTLAFQVR